MKHSDLDSVDEMRDARSVDDVRALARMLTWAERELEDLNLPKTKRSLRQTLLSLKDESGIQS